MQMRRRMVDRFPEDLELKNKFGSAFLMMNRNRDAKRVFHDVLQQEANNGFALVHYGFILKVEDGEVEEGVKYLRKGIKTGEPATLDRRFYFQLGDGLQRLGRRAEAYKVYEDGAKKGLFLSKYQRSVYNVKGLKAQPWWTTEQTTYATKLKAIEKEWMTIRQEALSLYNAEVALFNSEQDQLTESRPNEKELTLFSSGKKVPRNCELVPRTCEIVASRFRDAVECSRGQVKLWLPEAGSRIGPRCGPTNCRLRAQLGLLLSPKAHIKVANETRSWKEGKFIVFDDSFEHEVWHDGRGVHLLLSVDFWHPELTERQRAELPPV